MSKLKALATLLSKPQRLNALLSYGHKGYLAKIGWFRSFDAQQAMDDQGHALPWVTYSFIDFIKDRLNKTQSVFEYGSGSSTLFYAERVGRVVSVEHDESWYNKVLSTKPANAEIIYTKLETGGEYAQKAKLLGEKFHMIIVDGRDRVNCCKESIHALQPDGVIILDDAERPGYDEARLFLKDQNFKEISFTGISPGLFYPKATSVFYKSENCLAI